MFHFYENEKSNRSRFAETADLYKIWGDISASAK